MVFGHHVPTSWTDVQTSGGPRCRTANAASAVETPGQEVPLRRVDFRPKWFAIVLLHNTLHLQETVLPTITRARETCLRQASPVRR